MLAVILAAPILSACACSPTSRAAPTTSTVICSSTRKASSAGVTSSGVKSVVADAGVGSRVVSASGSRSVMSPWSPAFGFSFVTDGRSFFNTSSSIAVALCMRRLCRDRLKPSRGLFEGALADTRAHRACPATEGLGEGAALDNRNGRQVVTRSSVDDR